MQSPWLSSPPEATLLLSHHLSTDWESIWRPMHGLWQLTPRFWAERGRDGRVCVCVCVCVSASAGGHHEDTAQDPVERAHKCSCKWRVTTTVRSKNDCSWGSDSQTHPTRWSQPQTSIWTQCRYIHSVIRWFRLYDVIFSVVSVLTVVNNLSILNRPSLRLTNLRLENIRSYQSSPSRNLCVSPPKIDPVLGGHTRTTQPL